MSHTVLRGRATKAQLYLDFILESVLKTKKTKDINRITISEVLWHCMYNNRARLFMIDGLTNESFTNESILKLAVPLARALVSKCMIGKYVMLVLKNHMCMAAVYYGVLFAGAVPFSIEPNNTVYEFSHFMSLVHPTVIFCEESSVENIMKSVYAYNGHKPDVIIANRIFHLYRYTASYSDDLESFRVTDINIETPAAMLPTSGSTGQPKAALLEHKGLIAQLPVLWAYLSQFPRPTDLVMLLSTAQWMTHTVILTTCPVYEITLLMTSKPSTDGILAMIRQHKPTWVLIGPEFANTLFSAACPTDLTSLKTVLTTGAPPRLNSMKIVQEKLPLKVHLCNGYGMTETQGFASMPNLHTPYQSIGQIINSLDYKLVDECGNTVKSNQKGELLLRSNFCILKGYHRNENAFAECMTDDGWLKTGDIFFEDYNGFLYFVERKKFWFKYLNYQISPEELEAVITTLPGINECVVCESPRGAVAGVVPCPGLTLSTEDIHRVVNASLNEYKRLHGGVVVLERLPRTHSGKINRAQCCQLLNNATNIENINAK